MDNRFRRSLVTLMMWVVMPILIYTFGTSSARKNGNEPTALPISEFVAMTNKRQVASVKMNAENLTAEITDGKKVLVSYPMFYSPRIIDDLIKQGVPVTFIGSGQQSGGMKALMVLGQILSWLPIVLMLWLAYSIFRGMNGGNQSKGSGGNSGGGGLFGSNAFGFGKSKARMIDSKNLKVTFKDVAGIDEAKKDVAEVVDFLKDPYRYSKIGGVIPKGCLLIGYPGTGKTLLAKAIAAEAGVPFFFMSGSDFVEMFVGVGASRVRDLFAQAKRKAPCIVFIDEIDAVGRNRGVGIGGGNDEREQTLNQLLVEMDGFEENNGVIVIAATNRPDVLDPALLRPGRFDRQITITLPDIKGRASILDVHLKKIRHVPSVDSDVLARGTPGFSGADLANLVNEAALLAARHRKEVVTMDDVEMAKDKIMMGNTRNPIIKESERELTAYHEGGHALLAYALDASDPVHKITIIPRGRALGMVVRLPKDDQFSINLEKMKADIAVSLGGRVAEELVFGSERVTSGASSDIQQVTNIARSMVVKWGLSQKVGLINYAESERNSYLGRSGDTSPYNCSEETAALIDAEVRRIVDEGYELARKILTERRDDLELIARTLLDVETLGGDEFEKLIKNKEKPVKSGDRVFTGSPIRGVISGIGGVASILGRSDTLELSGDESGEDSSTKGVNKNDELNKSEVDISNKSTNGSVDNVEVAAGKSDDSVSKK